MKPLKPDADMPRAGSHVGEPCGPRGRVVFDLTTTAMWSGPPVGIVRVEQELARWGLDHVDGLDAAFFDPVTRTFRHFGAGMATRLMTQDVAIDTLDLPNPARKGARKSDRIPAAIRPLAMWVLQSRRMALQALERVRLTTGSPAMAAAADRFQRAIMNRKYKALMVMENGSRRGCLPLDMALGRPFEFTPRDILVCAGAGWAHSDIAAIMTLKRRTGFRLVLLCYDIIPLMFPHYYKPHDVEAHRRYVDVAFAAADLVVFTSRAVEADVRTYCDTNRIALGRTAVFTPGANVGSRNTAAPLPERLEPGRYALLVSTIEPRKGHDLIYRVWLRLLAVGVPQAARFKLVFVGRKGWLVDDLVHALRHDARLAGSIEILTAASDATMATLYRDAAFCLYPSHYEGYGLPVVEAFFYGKAVLASTGGAVPEAAGEFSPCLDPADADAWEEKLRTWIEQPAARAVYEDKIRSGFRQPGWDDAARAFFSLALGGSSGQTDDPGN